MSARQDGALVARLLEGTLQAAEFTCQTRDETSALAELLARLFPEPPRARFALGELLLNAVEHGNLEIGSALKARLLRELAFEGELAARHARAPYRARRVHVGVRIADGKLELEIRDEGIGFDWRAALRVDIAGLDVPCGRGIALIRDTCFPSLVYRDPGNVAIVRVAWS